MTVSELLIRIDSHELSEWMAYDQVEPFGDWRHDLRAGIVASTVANTQRRKEQRAFEPTDFMPDFERAARNEDGDVDHSLALFGQLAAAYAPSEPEAIEAQVERWFASADRDDKMAG